MADVVARQLPYDAGSPPAGQTELTVPAGSSVELKFTFTGNTKARIEQVASDQTKSELGQVDLDGDGAGTFTVAAADASFTVTGGSVDGGGALAFDDGNLGTVTLHLAPAPTTTAPAATTTAPAPTTTAPGPTTTAPAATTTAPGNTTTAPGSTTTAPGNTTTAPATTTTADSSPAVESVKVEIDPDDGIDHHQNSVQVSTSAKLKLVWSTRNATKTRIDPLGEQGASDSAVIPTSDATYSVVALNDAGAESPPFTMEVHTHEPGKVVSPHVDVKSGIAKIISFQALQNDAPVDSVLCDSTVKLVASVSGGCESATINGEECPLQDAGDTQTATLELKPDGKSPNLTCTLIVSKGGAEADKSTLTLIVSAPPGSTTTAPGSTTTAPGSTTTAPSSTTTAAAVSGPGSTTTVPVPAVLEFAANISNNADGSAGQDFTSIEGGYKDPANAAEYKNPGQHFSMNMKVITLTWKVTGFENAKVQLYTSWGKPGFAPAGEKSLTDYLTQQTKDGSGSVSFNWTEKGGNRPLAYLCADLRLVDPNDPKKILASRTIIAYTDSPVGGVNIAAKPDPAGASIHWAVSGIGSAPVYLSATDGSGAAIGSLLNPRKRGDTAKSGDVLVAFDPGAHAGQTITFTAAFLGQPGDTGGKSNPAPFDVGGEGLIVASQTTVLAIAAASTGGGSTAKTGGGGGDDQLPPVEFDKIAEEKKTWATVVKGPSHEWKLWETDKPLDLGKMFTATIVLNASVESAIVSREKGKETEGKAKSESTVSAKKIGEKFSLGAFETGNPVIDNLEFSFSPFEFEKKSKELEVAVIKGSAEFKVIGFKLWGNDVTVKMSIDLAAVSATIEGKSVKAGVGVWTVKAELAAAHHIGLTEFEANPTPADLDKVKEGTGWFVSITGKIELKATLTPTVALWRKLAEAVDALLASEAVAVALLPVGAVLMEVFFLWKLYSLWKEMQILNHCVSIVNLNTGWVATGFAKKLKEFSEATDTVPAVSDLDGIAGWAGDEEKFASKGAELSAAYLKKAREAHRASAAFQGWKSKNPDKSEDEIGKQVDADLKKMLAANLKKLQDEAYHSAWPLLRDDLYLNFERGAVSVADGGTLGDNMFMILYPGYSYCYNPGSEDVFNKGISQAFKWRGFREMSGNKATFPPRVTDREAKALLDAIEAWVKSGKAKGDPMPRTPPDSSTPAAIAAEEERKKKAKEARQPALDQYQRIRDWLATKNTGFGPVTKAKAYFSAHPGEKQLVEDKSFGNSLESIDNEEAQRLDQLAHPLG